MKIVPRGAWLVIEQIDATQVGGLFVPDGDKAQYKQGIVLAVPVDPTDEAKGISVGDRVVYDIVGSINFRLANDKFVMLKAREILGKIEI